MKNLDFMTRLYLYITGVVVQKEKKYTEQSINKNVAYIFDDYNEFKSYFEKYIINVREDLIDLAIYAKSKNGSIVALKGVCDHIITQTIIENSYLNLTQKQIDDTHSKSLILEKNKFH